MYFEAPDDVVEIFSNLIKEHHHHLRYAKIAIIIKDKAPVTQGRETLAKATKVSDQYQAIADYDFIIWVAQDSWSRCTPDQRHALADHELCHCGGNHEEGWIINKHDIEEFQAVLDRHGPWNEELIVMGRRLSGQQLALGLEGVEVEYNGRVGTFDPAKVQALLS